MTNVTLLMCQFYYQFHRKKRLMSNKEKVMLPPMSSFMLFVYFCGIGVRRLAFVAQDGEG